MLIFSILYYLERWHQDTKFTQYLDEAIKVLPENKYKLDLGKQLIFLWLCKYFAAQEKQPNDKLKTKENYYTYICHIR